MICCSALVFLSLSACTKDIPKVTHKEELSSSVSSSWHPDFLVGQDREKFVENLKSLTSDLIKKGKQVGNNADLLMKEVVLPLSSRILSKEFFEDDFLDIEETKDVFSEFNKFLLITLEDPNTRSRALKVVDLYDELIFLGCEQGGSCRNIKFFEGVLQTKLIVLSPLRYAHGNRCKLYKNIEDYYKRLEMAYVLQKIGSDYPVTDVYYLQCACERAAYLSDEYRKTKSTDFLKKKNNFLLDIRSILQQPDRILKSDDGEGFHRLLAEKLLQVNKRAVINSNNDLIKITHKIGDWLIQALLKLNLDEDEFESVFSKIYTELFSSKNIYHDMLSAINEKTPNLPHYMKLKALNKENLYLKILNGALSRRLTYNVARDFYNKLENKEEMKRVIKSFSDLIILYHINEANWHMRPVFMEKYIHPEELEDKLAKIGSLINIEVIKAYEQIGNLRDFASYVLSLSGEEIRELGLSADQFVPAIDYLLSHPHTMLIKHKLAETGFNGLLLDYPHGTGAHMRAGFRNTLRIESNKIYPKFFLKDNLKTSPWFFQDDFTFFRTNHKKRYTAIDDSLIFDYSSFLDEGGRIFTSYQKLHALNFLIRMDAFNTLNISLEDFLNKLISGMLLEYEKLIEDGYNRFLGTENNMQGSLSKVEFFCEEEKIRQDLFKKGEVYHPEYSFDVNILNLYDGHLVESDVFKDLFVSQENDSRNYNESLLMDLSSSWDKALLNLFNPSTMLRLDTLRLGEAALMRHIKLIFEIYREFRLDAANFSSASAESREEILRDIERQLSSFEEKIEKYKHKKRKFYTLLKNLNKFVLDGCNNLLFSRAIQINNLVYLKEMDYLREVYRDKVALMEVPEEDREQYYKNNIEPKFRFKNVDPVYQGYEGLDKFEDDKYHYNWLDSIFRVKEYLREIAPEIKVFPPTDFSTFYSSYLYPGKEIGRGLVPFMNNGSLISEEEFVKLGMRKNLLFENTKNRAWDFVLNATVENYVNNATYYFALLYKLGEQEHYSEDAVECLKSENYEPENCTINKSRLINLDTLIDRYLEISSAISIPEHQEKLLKIIGADEVRENLGFGYLYEPVLFGNTQSVPFLNHAYNIINHSHYFGNFSYKPWALAPENTRGKVQQSFINKWRNSVWHEMSSYQYSIEQLKYLPFSINKNVSHALLEDFRQIFMRELNMEKAFIDNAKKRELENKEVFVRFDFENNAPIYSKRSHRASMLRERFYGPYFDENSETVTEFQNKIKKI